jgi:hypothetical protein
MKKRSKLSPKSSYEGSEERTAKSRNVDMDVEPSLDETLLGMSEAGVLTGDILRNLLEKGASVSCLDEVMRALFSCFCLSTCTYSFQ